MVEKSQFDEIINSSQDNKTKLTSFQDLFKKQVASEMPFFDFKLACPDNLEEHLSAFSQLPNGGYLFFGVEDNSFDIKGISTADINEIKSKIDNWEESGKIRVFTYSEELEIWDIIKVWEIPIEDNIFLFILEFFCSTSMIYIRDKSKPVVFNRKGRSTRIIKDTNKVFRYVIDNYEMGKIKRRIIAVFLSIIEVVKFNYIYNHLFKRGEKLKEEATKRDFHNKNIYSDKEFLKTNMLVTDLHDSMIIRIKNDLFRIPLKKVAVIYTNKRNEDQYLIKNITTEEIFYTLDEIVSFFQLYINSIRRYHAVEMQAEIDIPNEKSLLLILFGDPSKLGNDFYHKEYIRHLCHYSDELQYNDEGNNWSISFAGEKVYFLGKRLRIEYDTENHDIIEKMIQTLK